MELETLRYFVEVAKAGNISHAAGQLHISQPALSRQISQLEEELGVSLLIRSKKGVQLTEEGQYLLTRARQIVELADQTALNIQQEAEISGSICLGSGEGLAARRICQVADEILQEYPKISFKLYSGNAELTEDLLEHGVIDFAVILGDRLKLEGFNTLRLPERERWGILVKQDDPLTEKEWIVPQDLKGKKLILSMQAIQDEAYASWNQNSVNPLKPYVIYSLVYNALPFIHSGESAMITFEHLVDERDSSIRFIPLYPEQTVSSTLIWKKNVVLSRAACLFLEKIRESIEMSGWSSSPHKGGS